MSYGYLISIKPNGEDGSRYPVSETNLTIGKSDECEIQINNLFLSDKHCEIKVSKSGQVSLKNLSINSSLLLQDKPIEYNKTGKVKHKDVFVVGKKSFRWEYPNDTIFYVPEISSAVKNGRKSMVEKSSAGGKLKAWPIIGRRSLANTKLLFSGQSPRKSMARRDSSVQRTPKNLSKIRSSARNFEVTPIISPKSSPQKTPKKESPPAVKSPEIRLVEVGVKRKSPESKRLERPSKRMKVAPVENKRVPVKKGKTASLPVRTALKLKGTLLKREIARAGKKPATKRKSLKSLNVSRKSLKDKKVTKPSTPVLSPKSASSSSSERRFSRRLSSRNPPSEEKVDAHELTPEILGLRPCRSASLTPTRKDPVETKTSASTSKKKSTSLLKSPDTSLNITQDVFVSPLDNSNLMEFTTPQVFRKISSVNETTQKLRTILDETVPEGKEVKTSNQGLVDLQGENGLFFPTKSPKNRLSDFKGVKNLFQSPKSPKTPNKGLDDLKGVKRLFELQISPKNRLSDFKGVRNLLASPKDPNLGLEDVAGVSKLFKLPPKSPKNRLSDLEGVKHLLRSRKSPNLGLQDVKGVKNLFKNSPNLGLDDLEGVEKLFENSAKVQKSSRRKFDDPSKFKKLWVSPNGNSEAMEDVFSEPSSSPSISARSLRPRKKVTTPQQQEEPKATRSRKKMELDKTATPKSTRKKQILSEIQSNEPKREKRVRSLKTDTEEPVASSGRKKTKTAEPKELKRTTRALKLSEEIVISSPEPYKAPRKPRTVEKKPTTVAALSSPSSSGKENNESPQPVRRGRKRTESKTEEKLEKKKLKATEANTTKRNTRSTRQKKGVA